MKRNAKVALVALAGAAVGAVLARLRKPAELPPLPDERAEELRRKLAEARAAAADQDDFEVAGMGAETIVEEEPPRPPAASSSARSSPRPRASRRRRTSSRRCDGASTRKARRRRRRCAAPPSPPSSLTLLSVHRNEHSVVIAAAPGDVFPWLADSARRCRWMGSPGRERAPRPTGRRSGAAATGTCSKTTASGSSSRPSSAEVDAPHRIVVQLAADAFEATIVQQLEEEDGGTRLTAVIETTYTGLAARLLSGLVTRHAQKQLEGDLDRLKALVESGRDSA